jgi:hypothetical protein
MGKIAHLDLASAVKSRLELGDAAGIYVKASDRYAFPGEGHGDGQSDITKPDDRELSTMGHVEQTPDLH